MSREAWNIATTELEALEKEMDAATAVAILPFKERYDALEARIEEIEEAGGEFIGRCEGCLEPIWQGERYAYDSENSVHMCQRCAPSYQDMLDRPEDFYNADGETLTPDAAKAAVDAHLASGGSLDDKMVQA